MQGKKHQSIKWVNFSCEGIGMWKMWRRKRNIYFVPNKWQFWVFLTNFVYINFDCIKKPFTKVSFELSADLPLALKSVSEKSPMALFLRLFLPRLFPLFPLLHLLQQELNEPICWKLLNRAKSLGCIPRTNFPPRCFSSPFWTPCFRALLICMVTLRGLGVIFFVFIMPCMCSRILFCVDPWPSLRSTMACMTSGRRRGCFPENFIFIRWSFGFGRNLPWLPPMFCWKIGKKNSYDYVRLRFHLPNKIIMKTDFRFSFFT